MQNKKTNNVQKKDAVKNPSHQVQSKPSTAAKKTVPVKKSQTSNKVQKKQSNNKPASVNSAKNKKCCKPVNNKKDTAVSGSKVQHPELNWCLPAPKQCVNPGTQISKQETNQEKESRYTIADVFRTVGQKVLSALADSGRSTYDVISSKSGTIAVVSPTLSVRPGVSRRVLSFKDLTIGITVVDEDVVLDSACNPGLSIRDDISAIVDRNWASVK